MDFCINHSTERAVGLCGTCRRPACYRCSLTIDQVIYCSTACFNERPAKAKPAAPAPAPPVLEDEFSDVVAAIDARTIAADRAALSEPSVVLSAHMADDHSQTTMLGMTPMPGLKPDGSSTLIMGGTKRSLLSSSCFFHPDTSAIVLCSKCRNPICTLCAKETPEGLACSPSCGPPDLVGVRERRKVALINLAIAAAVILVVCESSFVVWKGREEQLRVAAIPREPALQKVESHPDLRRADLLVKEATTLLRDAADGAEMGRRPGNDAAALTSWLNRAVNKLKQARDLYSNRSGEWTDPEIKKRLDNVTTLLEGLKVGGEPAPASDPARPASGQER
jgi:hypothetical protein